MQQLSPRLICKGSSGLSFSWNLDEFSAFNFILFSDVKRILENEVDFGKQKKQFLSSRKLLINSE